MLPLIARCGRGAAQHLTRPLLPAAARGAPWFAGQALPSTSVASSHIKDTDVQAKMGATVAEAFKRDAAAAASTLASTLSPHERQVLLASLCSKYSLPATDRKAYNDALFDAADKQAPKGVLTRQEFHAAMAEHSAPSLACTACGPPSRAALIRTALVRALPFVGFGFLDNLIMIIAGEQIDAVLGVKYGLTTMLAAGLGNIVADVAGVSFANTIETAVRRVRMFRDAPLTQAQLDMPSVRAARFLGAAGGVVVGCLLGLLPLFFTDRVFEKAGEEAAEAAAAAAAAGG